MADPMNAAEGYIFADLKQHLTCLRHGGQVGVLCLEALRLWWDIPAKMDLDDVLDWMVSKKPSGLIIDTIQLPVGDADPGQNVLRTGPSTLAPSRSNGATMSRTCSSGPCPAR